MVRNMRRNRPYFLPQDILLKILHFLPFASVLEWKRVSKEWKSLINHPKFFNRYHDKSLLLFVSNGSLYCTLVRHHDNKPAVMPSCTVHHIPIEFNDGRVQKLVSEPSNVVACVGSANSHFLMYNLFTGASSNVLDAPILNPPRVQDFSIGWLCYGFGYDHYADDYKIMVVCNYRNHKIGKWLNRAKMKQKMIDHNHNIGKWLNCPKMKQKMIDVNQVQTEDNCQFWVYSFRNRAWMTLQGFPYVADDWVCTRRACTLNGVLHWGFPKREDREALIVTYDLHTSRFGKLSEVPVDEDIWAYNLMELGGQVCYSIRDGYGLHVWVMKEYGVERSWTKLFSIDNSTSIPMGVSMKDMALYESRGGGKIVLFMCPCIAQLIWYDIEHGSAEVVEYDKSWKVRSWLDYIGFKLD